MPLSDLAPSNDFNEVLAAVQETPRGRWFLNEFAARNRSADTGRILAELGRMRGEAGHHRMDTLHRELADLSQTIVRTKQDIAEIKPSAAANSCHILSATGELDAIMTATESATTTILGAAEHLQELSAQMREQGLAPAFCDVLDNEANAILMACSFQDITGQRTSKVVNTLRYIEQRLNAMVEVWGVPGGPHFNPADARPAPRGEGVTQIGVDAFLTAGALPEFDGLIVADAPKTIAGLPGATIGQTEIDTLFE